MTNFDARGAIDLSALAQPQPSPSAAGSQAAGGQAAGNVVIDATDADIPALLERSRTVPVVIDLWAAWCQPCKQLGPVLEKLAHEFAGRFQLAKIDIDANQQVAQAFQVQSIPTVYVLIGGQPFQLFQGAHPESQLRQLFEEMLNMAAQQGVSGTLSSGDDEEAPQQPAEPELPPLHQEGIEAIERGDLDAAHAAFTKQLAQAPADKDAVLALRQVELMQRCEQIEDLEAAVKQAQDVSDVESQLRAADVEFAQGLVGPAFDRLLACVRATSGDERERVRVRLVELFELVGSDPRTNDYRRQLASALY